MFYTFVKHLKRFSLDWCLRENGPRPGEETGTVCSASIGTVQPCLALCVENLFVH